MKVASLFGLELHGVANVMIKLTFVFIAGGIGCLARYGLGIAMQKMAIGNLPLGTFIINMIGCFLFGIVWSLAEERQVLSQDMRLLLLTGFMGSFTTFSTFAFENNQLLKNSAWAAASSNMVFQVLLGVALVQCGMWLAKSITWTAAA
jgi:CrcB protein